MSKNRSKRYRKALEVKNVKPSFDLQEATKVLAQFERARFNETVELAANLDVDAKQSDQMVRGTVSLPHGSGKKVRVLAFTEKPQEALDAGADFAGLEDIIQKIQEGWMDFDVAIATPNAMKSVRNLARILGPRGLMPNPKSGTVCEDVATGVNAVKAGRVEFKMDKQANISIVVGQRSFSENQLLENIKAALDALVKAKPESVKGHFIRSMSLSSTMSPSVKIDSKEYAKF